MKRLVLLDSHAILHRGYHALPEFSTSRGEPTGALYGLSTMLISIIEELKPDYIAACYDLPGGTHRHEVYKEYKAGRAKTDEALIQQINRSRDIFTALSIPIYDAPGFEADDILGTIVEQLTHKTKSNIGNKEEVEIIIASGDMDTLQLVKGEQVKVYTLKKGIKDTVLYDEKAVNARYGFGPTLIPDYKGLRGDPSDNIPGIKGIGEKTATTLITSFGTVEDMYGQLESGHEKKFEAAGVKERIIELLKENKEEAEFSKMLATIRRDAPIDFHFPEKIFRDNLDIKKTNALWQELEFRTLGGRLAQALEGKKKALLRQGSEGQATKSNVSNENKEAKKISAEPSPNGTLSFASSVPADRLEKTATALWVINSNVTNPKLEDVLNFANAVDPSVGDDFAAAEKIVFEELKKRDVKGVYDSIESPLIPVLHKMEKRGVKIDRKMLTTLSKTYTAEVKKLEKEIWKYAGVEFNISSPKQLGDILFDTLGLKVKNAKKTSGGARSTRESELEKMRDMHPIVPRIFEYRELTKLLSTYIDAIPPLLDDEDRVHPHFIQSGAVTGRMASQNPGIQNIPIKSELGKAIRHAFIAEKGFKLASFDYSQMELRIAAFLSGDEKLISIFKKGEDVHTSVASFVFKVSPTEVTPAMRRQAKVINFGIIYGMGVLALKQNLGTTKEEAQRFLTEYFETFSGLATYLDRVKIEAGRRGFTETFYGRRRYFEGLNSRIPFIRAAAERMAINAPIQGTEADVIKIAMIDIDEYITKNKLEKDVYPLLQVHDELVYEIRADKAEKIAVEIEKIMETVMDPADTHGVILKAEAHIGDNWGELK